MLLAMQATAFEPVLAEKWRAGDDPSGYLVSEKLDGVRALWDGKKLSTRSGHDIHAPDWFIAGFPEQALDGELWIGRGRFSHVSSLIAGHNENDPRWHAVKYCIFELPDAAGDFIKDTLNNSSIPV